MGRWLNNSTFRNRAGRAAAGLLLAMLLPAGGPASAAGSESETAPAYKVDTSWPQKLPNDWIIGDVAGVNVDPAGHIWIVHRPSTLIFTDVGASANPPIAKCCVAAPPVIEFDSEGKVLRAWGGPDQVEDWFDSEHGIFVDDQDHVWVLGAGAHDGQLLKFTLDGKLLMRIGRKGDFVAADDTTMLGMPTDLYVDTKRKEVFVSDGYRNHRVIVFDTETGAFKRQWTAFGKKVDPAYFSGPEEIGSRGLSKQFDIFTTVHCVTEIGDEIFVCDRTNNRLQVFTPEGKFLREIFYNKDISGGAGSTWDAAPVPGHPDRIMALDGNNSEFAVLDTHSGEVLTSFLSKGRYAGQMHWPHQVAIDREGRIYIGEVQASNRVQRFVPNPEAARETAP